ncbi:MAG: TldD/PmbA family protein, partial [Candidatus Binatia bacterium]
MERLPLTQDLARDVLAQAKQKGATQGDVVMVEGDSFFATVRMGEIEKISQAQEKRLGLRLFSGKSSATASTSDISRDSIQRLIDDTWSLARATAKDDFSGLPPEEQLARGWVDLDLFDDSARSLTVEQRVRSAREAEESALSSDPKITNSEGAEFSNQTHRLIYANSHGFAGEYQGSTFSLSVVPVAALNGSMQRDFLYSTQRKFSLLDSPQA